VTEDQSKALEDFEKEKDMEIEDELGKKVELPSIK